MNLSPVTTEDFRFVGFPNISEFFEREGAYLHILPGRPSFELFDNVLYTPATRESATVTGCLYNRAGNRIEASSLRRGRNRLVSVDGLHGPVQSSTCKVFNGRAL